MRTHFNSNIFFFLADIDNKSDKSQLHTPRAAKTPFADRKNARANATITTPILTIQNPSGKLFQPKLAHTLNEIPIKYEMPKLNMAVFSDTDIERIMTACDSPPLPPIPPNSDEIFAVPPLQIGDMNWTDVRLEKQNVDQTDDFDLPPLMELDDEVFDCYF